MAETKNVGRFLEAAHEHEIGISQFHGYTSEPNKLCWILRFLLAWTNKTVCRSPPVRCGEATPRVATSFFRWKEVYSRLFCPLQHHCVICNESARKHNAYMRVKCWARATSHVWLRRRPTQLPPTEVAQFSAGGEPLVADTAGVRRCAADQAAQASRGDAEGVRCVLYPRNRWVVEVVCSLGSCPKVF